MRLIVGIDSIDAGAIYFGGMRLGGVLMAHIGKEKFPIDYGVYQPSLTDTSAVAKPPMAILFRPNINGPREIIRYLEAAKAIGLSLVSWLSIPASAKFILLQPGFISSRATVSD